MRRVCRHYRSHSPNVCSRGGEMKSFAFARAEDPQFAIQLVSQNPNTKFLGGGTNLIDLARENIEQPDRLVDITPLPFAEVEIRPDGSVRIGALVRNSHLAADESILE